MTASRPARGPRGALQALLIASLTTAAYAQTCTAVKDINGTANPISSTPSSSVQVGSWLYFTAETCDEGRELWRTQGTAAATELVKDVYPGRSSSGPNGLIEHGGYLYFFAFSSTTGYALWRSDGTANGTQPVTTLIPSGSSAVSCNGKLFFVFGNGTSWQAWTSDGTNAGTKKVWELAALFAIGKVELVCLQNRVFFNLGTASSGLYVSDGTSAGTRLLTGVAVNTLTPCGNAVYFVAADSTAGVELWSTDGTSAGTSIVKDIQAGSVSASPSDLVCCKDRLFFTASDGTNGRELWTSDGTSAGTVLVADLLAGSASSNPLALTCCNDRLFFFATNGSGRHVFVSDGTSAGTVALMPTSTLTTLHCCGTRVFMGPDLHVSDGTIPGTKRVGVSLVPTAIGCIGSDMLMAAQGPAPLEGVELWRSDGTVAGTTLLKDIEPDVTTNSGRVLNVTVVGGRLYFSADDGSGAGSELWTSDGTGSGTALVKDIDPGTPSSSPSAFTSLDHRCVFAARTVGAGFEPWVTDGTASGTMLLKDIAPGASHSSPQQLVRCGGYVIFSASDPTNGRELWRSDGTSAGTILLKDILSGTGNGVASAPMLCLGNKIYFQANDGQSGSELWCSDGTPAGTQLLKDINPGPASSAPQQFVVIDNTLWFTANDGVNGLEVWTSDGTASGTTLFKDLNPGSASGSPSGFTRCGSMIFFAATDATRGYELWKSDGTAAGTAFVADINPGTQSSSPQSLTCIGSSIVFSATDGTSTGRHGRELWISDGTASGTRLVADLYEQVTSSSPSNFVAVGELAYFTASALVDGRTIGRELWRTDGTTAGTKLVCDPNWITSSSPSPLQLMNGKAYFAANSDKIGQELFRIDDPGAHVETLGSLCAPHNPTLRATLPVLGTTMTVSGSDGPSSYVGVLIIGLPSATPTRIPGGCLAHTDRNAFYFGTTLLAPTWSAQIFVPNDPLLVGVGIVLQAWWVDTSVVSFSLSNGLLLGLGR